MSNHRWSSVWVHIVLQVMNPIVDVVIAWVTHRVNWLECFLEGVYPILISLTDRSFQYCPLLMGNDANDQNVGASLHALNPFCFVSGYLVCVHACVVCESPRASTAWAARAMMLWSQHGHHQQQEQWCDGARALTVRAINNTKKNSTSIIRKESHK